MDKLLLTNIGLLVVDSHKGEFVDKIRGLSYTVRLCAASITSPTPTPSPTSVRCY